MRAVRSPRFLTQEEAARVLQAAMARSAWDGLVVGIALVTGQRVPEIVHRLRWLGQGVTR